MVYMLRLLLKLWDLVEHLKHINAVQVAGNVLQFNILMPGSIIQNIRLCSHGSLVRSITLHFDAVGHSVRTHHRSFGFSVCVQVCSAIVKPVCQQMTNKTHPHCSRYQKCSLLSSISCAFVNFSHSHSEVSFCKESKIEGQNLKL